MTQEELKVLKSDLIDLALSLIDEKIELQIWKGEYVTLTFFKHIPSKFISVLPFKVSDYNDLYFSGNWKVADVILLIIRKIEIINLLLGETKIKF